MPFATLSSSTGWLPAYEAIMQAHLTKLMCLTSAMPAACRIEGLPTGSKPLYLRDALIKAWFGDKGDFKAIALIPGITVEYVALEWQEQVFYIKVKPGNAEGLMGREFAVQTLHLLLGGQSETLRIRLAY